MHSKRLEIILLDHDNVTCIFESLELKKAFSEPIIVFHEVKTALEYIENPENKEKKFLVLVEIFVPGKDGWEFLEECKRKCLERVQIIVVSSSISRLDKERAMEYPHVLDYFEKPITSKQFSNIQL